MLWVSPAAILLPAGISKRRGGEGSAGSGCHRPPPALEGGPLKVPGPGGRTPSWACRAWGGPGVPPPPQPLKPWPSCWQPGHRAGARRDLQPGTNPGGGEASACCARTCCQGSGKGNQPFRGALSQQGVKKVVAWDKRALVILKASAQCFCSGVQPGRASRSSTDFFSRPLPARGSHGVGVSWHGEKEASRGTSRASEGLWHGPSHTWGDFPLNRVRCGTSTGSSPGSCPWLKPAAAQHVLKDDLEGILRPLAGGLIGN